MQTKTLWPPLIASAVIMIGFFAVLCALLYTGAEPELVKQMVQALIVAFTLAVGYNIGSSRGSARKTEIAAEATKEAGL